jgi:hypothetical protein
MISLDGSLIVAVGVTNSTNNNWFCAIVKSGTVHVHCIDVHAAGLISRVIVLENSCFLKL